MVLKRMIGQGLGPYQNLVARCGLICANHYPFLQQRKYFGVVLLKSFCGSSVVQQMQRFYRTKEFIYGDGNASRDYLDSIGLTDRKRVISLHQNSHTGTAEKK